MIRIVTTGGSFDAPQSLNTDKVGTMTIDCQDCNNALLTYSLTDNTLNNSIAITRVIPGAQAPLRAGSSPAGRFC